MRVVVIGAGIIGLACAEELIAHGHDVDVVDPEPGQGATRAAAGMIAPAGEAWFGEEALLRLGRTSAALWPDYAAYLESASGVSVDLRRHGTVLVGYDHDDRLELRRRTALLAEADVHCEELDVATARRLEPALGRVAAAALLPGDHQVNPRRVARALTRMIGNRLIHQQVTELTRDGVVLGDGGRLRCDAVVLATGASARSWIPQVRPVLGEALRVRTDDPPHRVIRGLVRGRPVYLVPRAGGEVVIGATEEEHDGPPRPTAGGLYRLLDAARELLPGLERAEVLEFIARHRPGTGDNGPLLGYVEHPAHPRVLLAAGHYRGGVLLAPLTARIIRSLLAGEPAPAEALPFAADRFSSSPTKTGAPR